MALATAGEAAKLLEPELERSDEEKMVHIATMVAGETSRCRLSRDEIDSVWNSVAGQSKLVDPRMVITPGCDWGTCALGRTVFLEPDTLVAVRTEAQLAWTLGHEVAHLEERDPVNSHAAKVLVNFGVTDLTEQDCQQYSQQLEARADRRGAQIAARLGYEPESILKLVLGFRAGPRHPGGKRRAELVRQVFQDEGRPISEQTWRRLVTEADEHEAMMRSLHL